MLDPEEMQGPARFMLDRIARDNPKIDITKPIPISTISEAFQRMRSGSSFGSSSSDEDFITSAEKTSLVPGFGSATKTERVPVPGFGVNAEAPAIKIDEADLKEAEERMRRYDRNNDQVLDENELKEGRWSDAPMQYDRNRDGKLSLQELAMRYARRRVSSVQSTPDSQRRDSMSSSNRKKDDDKDRKEKEKPGLWDKRASYRLGEKDGAPVRPAGLPEWFTRYDTNLDNQVSMPETGKKWDQEALDSFFQFDTSGDGFITVQECLAGVKKGYIFGASGSVASSTQASPSTPTSTGGTPTASKPAAPAGSPAPAAAGIDPRMREWATKQLAKADKDGNGSLSLTEFSGDFAAADSNKDGKIDADEYAANRVSSRK
jgi:Ca2+-binding EF-hand superfamily protein